MAGLLVVDSHLRRRDVVRQIIEDGEAFLVMPLRGQASTLKAMQVKAPGVTWKHSEDSLVYYGLSLLDTSTKMKEILDSGIQLSNLKDLVSQFKKLKKSKFRNNPDDALKL